MYVDAYLPEEIVEEATIDLLSENLDLWVWHTGIWMVECGEAVELILLRTLDLEIYAKEVCKSASWPDEIEYLFCFHADLVVAANRFVLLDILHLYLRIILCVKDTRICASRKTRNSVRQGVYGRESTREGDKCRVKSKRRWALFRFMQVQRECETFLEGCQLEMR